MNTSSLPRSRPLALRRGLVLIALFVAGGVSAAEKAHFRPDSPEAASYSLPDVLTTNGGQKITTADEWMKVRRPEVLELFRKYVYGRVPATPFTETFKVVNEDHNAMNGAATLRQVEVTIAASGKSLVIHLSLFVPNAATKPAPTFLLICNRPPGDNIDPTRQKKSEFWPAEEGIARGYAMAAFFNGDVDPDDKKDVEFKDGIHPLLDQGPRPDDAWATIAAWAWGASRCLDYLVTDKAVDASRVAVVGHSRGGKTALWAGAQDTRFAIVCSNDSGCAGAALSRHRSPDKETVAAINRGFPHWFNRTFKTYGNRVDELPVDQHMLLALMAPRAVCVASASADLWSDPRGEFLSLVHARPVYQLFGYQALGSVTDMPAIGDGIHGDHAHYHLREGKHNLMLVDWTWYWDFADRLYGGATVKTAAR